MSIFPLNFRNFNKDKYIFSNDCGDFFFSDFNFLQKYSEEKLCNSDEKFLHNHGFSFEQIEDLNWTSFAYKWAKRQSRPDHISYVVLVPTLRCNLTCDYCQVSRAPETAYQFDWSDETYNAVLAYLDTLTTESIKIEFQGGEPTLRLDLLEKVRTYCRNKFKNSQFVVCTNLQNMNENHWHFLDAADTYVSTSLDGDRKTHQKYRTHDKETTEEFFENLKKCQRQLGSDKISALPTIDINKPPQFENFIQMFLEHGIASIYLRPVNYQGFARKRYTPAGEAEKWNDYYGKFIDYIIDRNFNSNNIVEEYYFTHCLKRVLQFGVDNHVDLRNPNFFAKDYILIDYDGKLYPSDEARMLSRIGLINLEIGNIFDGIDDDKLNLLNSRAFNNFDSECIHCPYQSYCGTDLIDDISRYQTIDYPKYDTWFCRRHLSVFDKVFEILLRKDEAVKLSLSHWLGLSSWNDNMILVHQ